ncbi:NACHT, LRR and PYD domains-containing protein 12-like [Stegostoma tigrinum]|uniref:NACHT, LRR and PYD domains-containing protein 12-like n=1 Tax=Stegostoma tigrinum TaxID=3053191 RepID=UPI00287053AE|nr:NACHT, LRR and PYD domains-containing protein 12-like [Stegostoma tigrinum]
MTTLNLLSIFIPELIQQHKDYLHKQNQEIRVTGENRRIWRFPLGESRINATIVASLGEQEQAGGALRSRCTEGGEFWRQAEGHLEEIPLDRLLGKHCEETRLSGTTLIVGPCGFGKSTVIQKIIHDWAAGQLYQEINVIFPFKVQQLNSIDGQTCLNDLVVDFFPHFTNWLQFLWKEPEKILFIFDDLHLLQKTIDLSQPPSGNDDESQSLGPEEFCEISHIVRCLINGQLLTGCSVLGASSPWKLQSLGNAGSHRAVDILGLGADSMKQYFRQHAAAGQPASDVLDYIEEDEALRTMYHNPRFCSVLCSMLKEGSPTPAATTRTMILLTYLTCLLNKCCYEDIIAHHMLLKLGSLAYWGICTKTVVFERANSSIMMEIRGNDGVSYVFIHSILKDFVAALFQSQNTPADQVMKMLTEWYNCADDRFKFILRFFIGLLSANTAKRTWLYQREQHSQSASSVSDWLREKLNSCIQNLESERIQKGLLEILYCLLEFGDAALVADVLARMKTIRFTKCPLKPSDRMALSKALMTVQEIEELDLDACGIGDEGIHQLDQVLHKCTVLSLKSNNLTDGCVETLISALHENAVLSKLDISNDDPHSDHANWLTDKSIPALPQFIHSNSLMKEIKSVCS